VTLPPFCRECPNLGNLATIVGHVTATGNGDLRWDCFNFLFQEIQIAAGPQLARISGSEAKFSYGTALLFSA
jgi:hypothetical protein